MVHIAQFETPSWIEDHEDTAQHDLAGSCSAPISVEDLIDLSENKEKTAAALSLNSVKLGYNHPMRGGDTLRSNLAALYSVKQSGVTKDDILITNGGIGANHIVFSALISPGDHVICHYPTFEQLYYTPESLGAEISFWKTDFSKKWLLDIDELKALIKPNTKLIVINNPNNPSGAVIPKSTLEQLVQLAGEKEITILSDEVFRPLFHSIHPSDEDFPPSSINLGYKNVIVTSSLSKSYGLPGIRVGWIACRNPEIIKACHRMRQYTTTAVSRIDDEIAAEALSDRCIHALLLRNIQLCQENVGHLQNFIDEHNWACSWVKPVAGSIVAVKFHKMGKPIDDEAFCLALQEKTGLMMCPASVCFGRRTDFKGYVRMGLGYQPTEMKASLALLAKFISDEYEHIPLAQKPQS